LAHEVVGEFATMPAGIRDDARPWCRGAPIEIKNDAGPGARRLFTGSSR
jgi:hypothetical protein